MSGLVESAPLTAVQQDASCSMLSAQVPAFDGESEEGLALRFGRKAPKKLPLTVEYTREPELIHQYVRIYRAECLKIPEFMAEEDEYDRKSHIMVIRQGNLVVGGARLFIKTPRVQKKLFLELIGFDIYDHFPELKHKELAFAELSRLVVLEDFRSVDILKQIIVNIHRKCVAANVYMFFALAPLVNARSYRQMSKALGISTATVHMDLDLPRDPGYEEIRNYLFSAYTNRELEDFSMVEHLVDSPAVEYV